LKVKLNGIKSAIESAGKTIGGNIRPQGSKLLGLAVTDSETGNPIKEASVKVTRGETTYNGETDNQGKAKFGELGLGRHDISVAGEGYRELSTSITIYKDREIQLELEPEFASRVVLLTIEGNVPVSDVQLDLVGKFGELAAETDDKGRAVLREVRTGEWNITAIADLYNDFETAEVIGAEDQTIRIEMQPLRGERLRIGILDRMNRRPVEGCRVEMTRRGKTTGYTSDEKGSVLITEPLMGRYSVAVRHDIYEESTDDFLLETDVVDREYEIDRRQSEIEIEALNSMTKRGIRNLEISLHDLEELGVDVAAQTDDDGKAYLGEHPYGLYSLGFSKPGYSKMTIERVMEDPHLDLQLEIHPLLSCNPEQLRTLQKARSELSNKIRELRVGDYDKYLPHFFFNLGVALIAAAIEVACTPEYYRDGKERHGPASEAATKMAAEALERLSRMVKMPRNIRVYDAAKSLPQEGKLPNLSVRDREREEIMSLLYNPMEFSASGSQDQLALSDQLEERISSDIAGMELYPVKYLQGLSNQMRDLETTSAYEKAFAVFLSKMILRSCFFFLTNANLRERLRAASA